MKKLYLHGRMVFAMLAAVFLLVACGDDDSSSPSIMVVVDRTTGTIYSIDADDASRVALGTVTLDGSGLAEIRGMVYSKADDMLFVSATVDGSGKLYSVDPTTLVATEINSNPDGNWDGIADLLMTDDGQIMGSIYFNSGNTDTGSGPGLGFFSTSGTLSSSVAFSDDDICCGMGMVYSDHSEDEIIIAGYEMVIYTSDLDGTVHPTKMILDDGDDELSSDYIYIRNLVMYKGTLYALYYNSDEGNTYLGIADLDAGTLTSVGQVNDSGTSTRFHGLMAVNPKVLN